MPAINHRAIRCSIPLTLIRCLHESLNLLLPIHRRSQYPDPFGSDKLHRIHILMVDRLILLLTHKRTQLGQWHGMPLHIRDWQLDQAHDL